MQFCNKIRLRKPKRNKNKIKSTHRRSEREGKHQTSCCPTDYKSSAWTLAMRRSTQKQKKHHTTTTKSISRASKHGNTNKVHEQDERVREWERERETCLCILVRQITSPLPFWSEQASIKRSSSLLSSSSLSPRWDDLLGTEIEEQIFRWELRISSDLMNLYSDPLSSLSPTQSSKIPSTIKECRKWFKK